jgi:hypothetical protein
VQRSDVAEADQPLARCRDALGRELRQEARRAVAATCRDDRRGRALVERPLEIMEALGVRAGQEAAARKHGGSYLHLVARAEQSRASIEAIAIERAGGSDDVDLSARGERERPGEAQHARQRGMAAPGRRRPEILGGWLLLADCQGVITRVSRGLAACG